MKTRALILFLSVIFSRSLFAQGAILKDPFASAFSVLRDTSNVQSRPPLPDQWFVLKKLPVPGDQGKVASCTGFAVVHGMLLMTAVVLGLEEANRKRGSGSYIYNHVFEKDCNSGAFLSQALSWASRKGVCPLSRFADDPINCDPMGPLPDDEKGHYFIDTFYLVCNWLATGDPILWDTAR